MPTEVLASSTGSATAVALRAPAIYYLEINRYRGIKALSWRPTRGVNVILGGGDVGKTTILDAIGLLLSPTNPWILSDTDYYARKIADGFTIEAVMTLPSDSGINYQVKPCWPWEWNGSEPVVPDPDASGASEGEPVYRLRVRGTEDLELAYEIVQPDGSADGLSVGLRRSIGLVRLGGDDRNDRDLRLVQGSALDRLLSDKSLRSRMAADLAKSDVAGQLDPEKKKALASLDEAFLQERLPHGLDLSITGGQGASIASMVGLTAQCEGLQLPVATWGAGTRRLSALAIAEQNHGEAPITIVDEVERGLESYRQRALVAKLQARRSQTFVTTHSPFVIAAASTAAFWYVDPGGRIGPLDGKKISRVRVADPGAFLSRLCVIGEGATEVGFVSALLERALGSPLDTHGIHVCDGGANETTLELLEALTDGGLRFAGFADNEDKHPTRWQRVSQVLGDLLFRWPSGCIEQNIIGVVPDEMLETLLIDPDDEKTGTRRHTLSFRLGIEAKDFATIVSVAGDALRTLMIEAATGSVPLDKKAAAKNERKVYEKHSQMWFKTEVGGRELEAKLFGLGLWPKLKDQLLPFCNSVRKAAGLPEIADLKR